MTEQEAIDYLLDPIGKREQHDEAIALAVSALKKQIPVKPTRIDKNETFDGNWIKVCPNCRRILIERITKSYSSYPRIYNMTAHCICGQAIDWDDTENDRAKYLKMKKIVYQGSKDD